MKKILSCFFLSLGLLMLSGCASDPNWAQEFCNPYDGFVRGMNEGLSTWSTRNPGPADGCPPGTDVAAINAAYTQGYNMGSKHKGD